MRIKQLVKLVMAFVIVGSLNHPARSLAQSSERDDSLKPFTACDLHDGLRIVQVDRLPRKVKSRTVKTSSGDQKISLADGYRVMVAYNDQRDWFANIKAEKSVAGEYERDKQNAIENLKWAMSVGTEMETQEPVKISFGEFEGYASARRTLVGNMLGIYVLFSDADATITTFYFINQNSNRKRFQTIEEWRVVRDEFLKTYTACAKNNRSVRS
jgi:hypothetical protein